MSSCYYEYANVICYPRYDENEFKKRVSILNFYNISLINAGNTKINNINILGKGHTSVVIKGILNGLEVAIKIRRMDSRRKNMINEANNLRFANAIQIGPKLFYANEEMIIMEYIKGISIKQFLKEGDVRLIANKIFEQCFKLDMHHLDHGELNRMDKHVIVKDNDVKIIDFDCASRMRRTSNLICAIQYLVRNNVFNGDEILFKTLRKYKGCICNDCYKELLLSLKVK